MPTYQYRANDEHDACEHCRDGFDIVQKLNEARLTQCPQCGAPIRKVLSAPAIGRSQAGFDDRAKAAGFSKLKRLGKGEYEKQY